jgi:phospholipid/cholesterol/gamma-HCH transport system substrate-binding protein
VSTIRSRAVALAAVLLVIAALLLVFAQLNSGSYKTATAVFPRTVGISQGSSVRVLGVEVGKVTSVTPEGTGVRVGMKYKSDTKIPANAAAAIVPPSIVSDRYIQFTPAYTGGAVLADKVSLGMDRTEVPVELDQVYASINDLDQALGPNGANKNGALQDLLHVAAQNLAGNGQNINTTVHQVANLLSTLGDNKTDLFATITNLQQFTTTLANDDGGVRQLNANLATVSDQLNSERTDLTAAIQNLGQALSQVQTFVADNKTNVTTDVAALTSVTNGLVSEQQALKEILDEAPIGLDNLALAFDPDGKDGGANPTLRTKATVDSKALLGLGNPLNFLCQAVPALPVCPGGVLSGAINGAVGGNLPLINNMLNGGAPTASGTVSGDQALMQLLGVSK